jgi:hypothetical protein
MTFEPKIWKDWPDLSTPISGAALTDMENRLAGFIAAGGAGMDWKGDWDEEVTYEPGDSVYYNDGQGSFIATDTTTGVPPFPEVFTGAFGSWNLQTAPDVVGGLVDGLVIMNSPDPMTVTKLWFANIDANGEDVSQYVATQFLPTQSLSLGWPAPVPPAWEYDGSQPGAYAFLFQIHSPAVLLAGYWEVEVHGIGWNSVIEGPLVPGEKYCATIYNPGYGWSEPNEGWDWLAKNGQQGPQGQGLYIRGPWHPLNTYGYQDVVNYPGIGDTQYVYTGDTQTDPGSPVPPAAPWAVFLESNPAPPIVTAIPGLANDKEEVFLQNAAMANLGVRWHFAYRESATARKWEFIGGGSLWGASSTRTSRAGTSFQTVGPVLTVPATGDYELTMSCDLDLPADDVSTFCYAGLLIAGVTPPSSYQIKRSGLEGGPTFPTTRSMTLILTNLNLNDTLQIGLATSGAGVTAGIGSMRLLLRPIRVAPGS